MKKFLLYIWIPLVVIVVPFVYGWMTTPHPKITENEIGNVAYRMPEDKCIEEAKLEAQANINDLNSSLQQNDENFSWAIKSLFKEGQSSEHLWVQVQSYKNNIYVGNIANDPVYIRQFKFGDVINLSKDNVEDWIIRDKKSGQIVKGGFSLNCFNN